MPSRRSRKNLHGLFWNSASLALLVRVFVHFLNRCIIPNIPFQNFLQYNHKNIQSTLTKVYEFSFLQVGIYKVFL